MKTKFLNIVLLEDLPFEELVPRVEKAFNTPLPYENKKGRYIAAGDMGDYKVSVIDRKDDLGDVLSDDFHVLTISVNFEDTIDLEKIESEIKSKLEKENVKWESGIWSKTTADEVYRKIYPE